MATTPLQDISLVIIENESKQWVVNAVTIRVGGRWQETLQDKTNCLLIMDDQANLTDEHHTTLDNIFNLLFSTIFADAARHKRVVLGIFRKDIESCGGEDSGGQGTPSPWPARGLAVPSICSNPIPTGESRGVSSWKASKQSIAFLSANLHTTPQIYGKIFFRMKTMVDQLFHSWDYIKRRNEAHWWWSGTQCHDGRCCTK